MAEDIQKATEIAETKEAWVQDIITKTVEVQAVAEELTTDKATAQAVAEAEQEEQAGQQDAQQQQTELDHLVVQEDLDLALEHLAVHKVHLITGLHG